MESNFLETLANATKTNEMKLHGYAIHFFQDKYKNNKYQNLDNLEELFCEC